MESVSRERQFHCDYCRKDISRSCHIRCAQCADFDLCLECFAGGVEVLDHRASHDYRIMEYVTTPIFEAEWGAEEEALLLEAVEASGFGNWLDVAEQVGSKSKHKCETHYNAVYMLSESAPFPEFVGELLDPRNNYRKLDDSMADRKLGAVPAEEDAAIIQENVEKTAQAKRNAKRRSSVHRKSSQSGWKGGAVADIGRYKPEGLAASIGYTPLRGDFDKEYDDGFEQIISDIEFLDSDTPEEMDVKLRVLRLYNETLRERQRRKAFILERNLLSSKDHKRPKVEREIVRNFNVFSRYHSKEDHEQFINGILAEYRIRQRIQKLQAYRLLGLKTLADCDRYELETKKTEMQEALKRSKGDSVIGSKHSFTPASRSLSRRGSALVDVSQHEKEHALKEKLSEFDISKMEQYQELSTVERQVCVKMQLSPLQYFAIRDSILKECVARGVINVEGGQQLLNIDINKTKKLFDFFVSEGWEMNVPASSNMDVDQ